MGLLTHPHAKKPPKILTPFFYSPLLSLPSPPLHSSPPGSLSLSLYSPPPLISSPPLLSSPSRQQAPAAAVGKCGGFLLFSHTPPLLLLPLEGGGGIRHWGMTEDARRWCGSDNGRPPPTQHRWGGVADIARTDSTASTLSCAVVADLEVVRCGGNGSDGGEAQQLSQARIRWRPHSPCTAAADRTVGRHGGSRSSSGEARRPLPMRIRRRPRSPCTAAADLVVGRHSAGETSSGEAWRWRIRLR